MRNELWPAVRHRRRGRVKSPGLTRSDHVGGHPQRRKLSGMGLFGSRADRQRLVQVLGKPGARRKHSQDRTRWGRHWALGKWGISALISRFFCAIISAKRTYHYRDPIPVKAQNETVGMIVATVRGAIGWINEQDCTYRIWISITSEVPDQPGIPLPRGVNVRTEWFLRQLYDKKNPGRLIVYHYGDQPIEKTERVSFHEQGWPVPAFTKPEELTNKAHLVYEDKQPSAVIYRATLRIKDKERLSGEGSAEITMTGREFGEPADQFPNNLSKTMRQARMRSILVKWAFSVRPPFRYLEFGQAGQPDIR